MYYDSIAFLCFFLPILLVLEAFVKGTRGKNIFLLAAGVVFYASGSFHALILLLISAAVNWGLGLLAMHGKKTAVFLAVVLNIGLLAAYRYSGVWIPVFSAAGVSIPAAALAMPAGLSFFTFKGISYVADVSRRREAGSRSFFDVLFYLSFFPQIMSGPLERFEAFRQQLSVRDRSAVRTARGLRRFALGLAKKLILSGEAGLVANAAFSAGEALDARIAWLGVLAYCLQLYFDFSGYSDMAVGLGEALGFHSPENFRYPYAAVSISDFWRRWHMSLSFWFRDYLYIPLGGSRKGKLRTAINKFIVFALCGLWHGAGLTFLLWGAWHGLLAALESARILNVERWRKTAPGRVLSRVYLLLAVCLGFVMFRAESAKAGADMLAAMFTGFSFTAEGDFLLHRICGGYTMLMLAAAAVLAMPVLPAFRKKLETLPSGAQRIAEGGSYLAALLLLVLCFAALASGGFSPFIYAQF